MSEMENLLHSISLTKNTAIVQVNKDNLKELPLGAWLEEIEKLRNGAAVLNVDSLLEYMEKFKQFYEEDNLLVQDPRE